MTVSMLFFISRREPRNRVCVTRFHVVPQRHATQLVCRKSLASQVTFGIKKELWCAGMQNIKCKSTSTHAGGSRRGYFGIRPCEAPSSLPTCRSYRQGCCVCTVLVGCNEPWGRSDFAGVEKEGLLSAQYIRCEVRVSLQGEGRATETFRYTANWNFLN